MTGIKEIAESLGSELKRRLPKQRKTQRTKLALLVSTMLNVRSANLMDLAAGLPREADRTDMRYQRIARLLGNPLVISDGDHGAVRPRGPGAGARPRRPARADPGPVQTL